MSGPLGWRPGPVDERDRPLTAHVARLKAPRTSGGRWWANSHRLNQGLEGACVGFSVTQLANAQPKPHDYTGEFAATLYRRAQELDEFADTPPEDGTSVRAGGKAAKERGLFSAYAFSYSLEEVALWILNQGPVVIGVTWRTGADVPDSAEKYFIDPLAGQIRGGHAILVDGVRWGMGGDYFRLLNSWGPEWGYDGRCKVERGAMEAWLAEKNTVAMTAVEI